MVSKLELICKQCGAPFYRYPSQAVPPHGRYCSLRCNGLANGIHQARGMDDSQWHNGIDSFRKAAKVVGARCNRCGTHADLTAHHIDRDRKNNIPENREILCQRCHKLEHSRKPSKRAKKICEWCGAEFMAWPHEAEQKCCSKPCAYSARVEKTRLEREAILEEKQRQAALRVNIPVGLCQCGCGQTTKIADQNKRPGEVKGQPLRFIHGHNGRVGH